VLFNFKAYFISVAYFALFCLIYQEVNMKAINKSFVFTLALLFLMPTASTLVYGNESSVEIVGAPWTIYDGIPRDIFSDGDVFTDSEDITWTMIGSVPRSTRIENKHDGLWGGAPR